MKKFSISKTDIFISLFISIFYIFISFRAYPLFERLEMIIYSVQMRLDLPKSQGENKIAIVNIDDKSLKQLGPWPWPRYLIAEMINILKSNGAKLIGLDLLFSHKEQNQGLKEVKKLYRNILEQKKNADNGSSYVWLLKDLKDIEKRLDNDNKLLQTVKESGNIVFPVVGKYGQYNSELVIPSDSFLEENCFNAKYIGKDLKKSISVNRLITPFPELSRDAHGLGHINLSPDKLMAGQLHIPFINYRGNIIPSMPLRLALDYLSKYPEQVIIRGKGIKLNSKIIPLTHGGVFVRFRGAKKSFPYYSFVDILNVKKVPAVFDGKIVLIGFASEEDGVSINTPVDPRMPRIEYVANIIDDFINGRFLKRPDRMIYIESVMIILFGLVISAFFTKLHYFPRTIMFGTMLFSIFLTGLIIFIVLDIRFKIVYICFSILTLYVIFSIKEILIREKSLELSTRESIETNRMLGLSLQSQGLLDLAFEKLRKCPLDDAMKDVVYNLGVDFERKRMINKAINIYEYIVSTGGPFRDLNTRIPKLRKFADEMSLGKFGGKQDGKLIVSDELQTKPTVGRYEILSQLGQGAMGIVYKGNDPRINRLVAIKTIRFSDEFEKEQVKEIKERFFKEAELAGKLSHSAIISIYDVGEDYELTYMAMELLDGKNLENFCRKDTLLPLRKVLDIVAETAEALDYAHDQGVIHRDIKPGNIMLLKNGRIKITDFGIAKAISSSQTRTGVILGTPNYMSPEQINGMQIDGRSDIFSLGVVFFQLLTGEVPFHGKSLAELFYQITQVKHPSPREINPGVIRPCVEIIDKAMKKDPNQRFKRAGVFARYLRILGNKIDEAKAKRKEKKQE